MTNRTDEHFDAISQVVEAHPITGHRSIISIPNTQAPPLPDTNVMAETTFDKLKAQKDALVARNAASARNAALDEAARMAETTGVRLGGANTTSTGIRIAQAIRALKTCGGPDALRRDGLEQAAATPLPGGGQEAWTLMLRDKVAMASFCLFLGAALVAVALS